MKCLKCNEEMIEISLPLSSELSFRCKNCHDKIKSAQSRLNDAMKEKELNDAREQSGISKRLLGVTFNDFKTTCSQSSEALSKSLSYLSKVKSKQRVGGLALIGRCGTGKTMIAAAMIEELGYSNFTSRIKTLSEITLQLKDTWRSDSLSSEYDLIKFYTSYVDLLIIDEIGCQRNSETEALMLFNILDGRYNNMLPTVLISNLSLQDFKSVIGERCYDRLKDDGGKVIAFNWESARK